MTNVPSNKYLSLTGILQKLRGENALFLVYGDPSSLELARKHSLDARAYLEAFHKLVKVYAFIIFKINQAKT